MNDRAPTIGEAADRCDLSADTLRYWEDRGVIPEPPRDDSSGYRRYPPDLIRRIRAVDRARELGFELDEIRRLFDGVDRGETCEELGDIARARIETFQKEIERLEAKIEGLQSLADACPGDLPATDCPVIDLFVDD